MVATHAPLCNTVPSNNLSPKSVEILALKELSTENCFKLHSTSKNQSHLLSPTTLCLQLPSTTNYPPRLSHNIS